MTFIKKFVEDTFRFGLAQTGNGVNSAGRWDPSLWSVDRGKEPLSVGHVSSGKGGKLGCSWRAYLVTGGTQLENIPRHYPRVRRCVRPEHGNISPLKILWRAKQKVNLLPVSPTAALSAPQSAVNR